MAWWGRWKATNSLTPLRSQAVSISSASARLDGHRLLAEDRLGPARGGGDGHLGVLAVPGADVDEVRPLVVEHLPVVGVAVVLGDAEEVAELPAGVGVGVGDGADRRRLPGDACPAAGVDAGDGATGDDGGAVLGHGGLLLPQSAPGVYRSRCSGRSGPGPGLGAAALRGVCGGALHQAQQVLDVEGLEEEHRGLDAGRLLGAVREGGEGDDGGVGPG